MVWAGVSIRVLVLAGTVLAGLVLAGLAVLALIRAGIAGGSDSPERDAKPLSPADLSPSLPADTLIEAIGRATRERARQTVPALVRLLDAGDTRVSDAAVRALGEIGDESALPHLLDRVIALDTAGSKEPPSVESGASLPVVGAQSHSGPGPPSRSDVQDSRALPGEVSAPPGAMLWANPVTMRAELDRGLDISGGRIEQALLALARSNDLPPADRYFALRNLELVGGATKVADILDLTLDSQPLVRLGAVILVKELAQAGAGEGRDILVAATLDSHATVRARALLALAELHPDEARYVAERLAHDADAAVAHLAREILAHGPM